MPNRFEILTAIRTLRNDIMRKKSGTGTREKLRYQCDRIRDLDLPGEDYASADMPDPLFTDEKGHSIRIVPHEGTSGYIVSLTGKKILGIVPDITNEGLVISTLTQLTGGKKWKRKTLKFR